MYVGDYIYIGLYEAYNCDAFIKLWMCKCNNVCIYIGKVIMNILIHV